MEKTSIFIWTEAFNCGEILQPMLSSYLKHNNYPIHVYGTDADFAEVSVKSDLIKYMNISKKTNLLFNSIEFKVLKGYRKGHLGTAILWEHIINSRAEKVFIHLDTDTIFVGDVISDLVNAILEEGNSIAGSRRPYRNRHYRKTGKDGFNLDLRPDAVNTDCFAFTTKYIRKHPKFLLRRKILGRKVSLKPVVDFFDPLTFEIISRGGNIKYMDSPDDGPHANLNLTSKFMMSRISFAAVGSGCNFYKNGSIGIPDGYSSFALAAYSLFAQEFLEKNTGLPIMNDKIILEKISRLDKKNWILRDSD